MSLLLDALKKTGATQPGLSAQSESSGLSELTLTELAPESTPSSPRSTGENLFAAKKIPARTQFQYNLGIIPTALIIGLILGVAGGIYIWIEIQPPKLAQYRSAPPALTASTPTAPQPSTPLAFSLDSTHDAATAANIPPLVPKAENSIVRNSRLPGKVQRLAATPPPSLVSRPGHNPAASPAQAIQILRQADNDVIYTTLSAAYLAYKSGDVNMAWQRYREVLLKDPKNRDALLGMAAVAQQQGQDDAAIHYYKQVLILDPRDPVAHAGMSAFSTADAGTKESQLKLSLAHTPQSAALHFSLGNLYTEQSRWGDAQQAYFNAYRLEPSNAQFAFNLATSLDHLGQAKIAAQYYGIALQSDATGNAGFDRIATQQRMNQLLAP